MIDFLFVALAAFVAFAAVVGVFGLGFIVGFLTAAQLKG